MYVVFEFFENSILLLYWIIIIRGFSALIKNYLGISLDNYAISG
jgi:hypothetical protein